jgi:hypothetical protein
MTTTIISAPLSWPPKATVFKEVDCKNLSAPQMRMCAVEFLLAHAAFTTSPRPYRCHYGCSVINSEQFNVTYFPSPLETRQLKVLSSQVFSESMRKVPFIVCMSRVLALKHAVFGTPLLCDLVIPGQPTGKWGSRPKKNGHYRRDQFSPASQGTAHAQLTACITLPLYILYVSYSATRHLQVGGCQGALDFRKGCATKDVKLTKARVASRGDFQITHTDRGNFMTGCQTVCSCIKLIL